jgi:formylglycine-generating enzyme required for sulfatase activity
VTITLPFRLGTTEVTQQQFRERRGYNPSRFASCGESCPVEQVSWHEAAAYCNALSAAEKLPPCYTCTGSAQEVRCSESSGHAGRIHTCPGYRLPTEAEWEYAYRAGTTTAFYNGPIGTRCDEDPRASEIGWYQSNSGGQPHPVGRKKGNAWGLLDLPGNVWEWCHDGFVEDLGSSPATDPQGAAQSPSRVLRGSSWLDGAGHLRAADRFGYPPAGRNSNIGFRCARRE